MIYSNNTAIHLSEKYSRSNSRLSTIGKIFIGILFIVVFEGALRKWISSTLTNPLVLLRDALALCGIYWALKSGHLNFKKSGAQILLIWTVIFLIWGLLQTIVNQSSPLIFIIGARFWLLYLWFGYAAAVSLTAYDFSCIAKTILLFLLLMAPLGVLQHFLPPGVFLNKQLDGDESTVFRLNADIVRTTGTFSFTLGNAIFLAFATPFALSLLAPGNNLWRNKWMPKICVLALGIASIVSGSRAAVIFFGLLFSVHIFTSLRYAKRSRKGHAILALVIMMVLFALVLYIFSSAVDATQERFESAADSEDLIGRVMTIFFGEPGVYRDFSLLGQGVGLGTNFAGGGQFLLAETEPGRIVLEGGLLGFLFIALKLVVISIGIPRSLSIARLTGNSFPFMLWFTTAIALFSWSIILQLTVNALGYLLVGLAIASLRLAPRGT